MNAHRPAVERPLFQLRPITRAVVGLFLVGAPFSTHALPTGAAVSAGTAAISQSGSALTVQQATPRLAINWQSFGIGAGESVVFKQPEAGSIALNRILGQDPSVILGSLSANGQVFILNPNGVLFGAGAQVDVGGIVASTLSLSDADFLASRYTFANTGSAGSVVNKGTIRAAEGGYVALVGPQVVNEGVIAARLGTVALGAGDQVTLQLAGSSLVGFSVDKAAVDALAANRQLIQADGGTVILSAQARDALLSTVVNNDGIVEARSVSTKNGVIRLEGGASGVVSVSGRLDASGVSAGETGGTVTITGNKVGLIDSAVVDASGNSGGGAVYIGGSRQGLGPLPNSEALFVGNDAQVRADATQAGRGGAIIAYADDTARIYGSLQARGGAAGGDGGFIETSGKRFLDVARTPDTTAPFGKGGEWLIDPYDITIGVGAGCASMSSATCPNGPGAQSWTSTNTSATVAAANINAALSAGNSVTIATGAGGAEAGNITVASAIGKTAGGNATLTLTAANNIAFNAGANLGSTSNQLNVVLNAGGSITDPANVNTNGGALTFNVAGASTQSGAISGTGSVVKNGAGTLTVSGANTYTGATAVNGGVLRVQGNSALGTAAGATTVASGAALEVDGSGLAIAEPLTLNGTGVGGGGALRNLANANTLTGAITLGAGGARINADAGTLTISGAGNITGATQPLTVGGAGNTTIGKVIATTSGTLTKDGTGTLTLSGANTYTGATLVNAGTLAVTVNNALGTNAAGTTVASGATLDLRNVIYTTTEAVTLNGGTLAASTGTSSLAGAVSLGAASTVNVTGTQLTMSGAVNNAGFGLTVDGTGNTIASGVVSGAGALTKQGPGTLTLSGNNTYTGNTSINAGTLQLGAANRIADTSAVTVASGATFNLNNFAETVGSISGAGNIALGSVTLTAGGNNTSTAFSGAVSGTGGLTKAGTGTFTLSGTNTYTGTTTVSAGTLALSNGAAIADSGAVNMSAAGANLTLNAGETIGSLAGVAGTTVTLGGNTLTAGGNNSTTTYAGVIGGTGGITKVGTGTMTLSSANTFGGTTTINAGTLALSGGSAIVDAGIVNLNGGTLLVSTAETIGRLSGASGTTVTLNAGLTFGDATDTTIGSTIGGAGTLVKQGTGTLTVSGANTYTGATAVNGGVLRVQGNSALGTAAGATTVASGAALEVDGSGLAIAEPLTLNGTGVGGGGALRNLANANTLTGAITLGAGGARINADAGTLTISGAGNITGATQPLTVGGAGNTTIGKVIATTSGTLTKDGTGTLTLSGANTYTGATLVNAGTLAVTVNNALGTNAAGTTVASGATLDLRNVIYTTTEAVTLNGGTLAASTGTSSLAGAVSLGAASTVNVTGTQLTMSGAVNNAGFGLTVDGTGNTIASGVVSGAGALTKQGPGTLTLSGNNTYTGNTSINAGTLIATNANALGSTGSGTTVNSGATLELDGTLTYAEPVALNNATLTWVAGNPTLNGGVALTGSNTVNGGAGTFTLGGVIGGTGGFDKIGAGTVVVSGNNTYTGITQVSAGTLQVSSNNGLGSSAGATNVGSNGRLTLNGVAIGAEPVTLNGPGLLGTGAITSNGVASLAGPITLAADSVIAPNAGSTLSLGGSLNGPAGLTTGGSGTLNLNGSVGNVSPLAFLTTGATGTTGINASVVRTSGTQSYNNPTTISAGVTLQSTGGNLVATTPVTAVSGTLSLSAAGSVNFNNAGNNFNTVNLNAGGNVALRDANAIVLGPSSVGGAFAVTANGAVTQTGAITVGGASTVNAGTGPITLSGANDFGGDIALTTTGTARLNDVNNLTLGASSANTFTATAGAGITLNGSVTATAGGSSIVLAGTTFTNNAGPFALNPGPGRWLVWSTNPASDTRGGLAYNFKQYNATFGITPVLGGGNGFLYSLVPSITPTLTGTVAKVYDGTNIATLTGANYLATGAVDGDTVTLNNPSAGTYDNRNVGTSKPVAVSGISIASATNGAATVYGYQLASTSATGTVGTITAAPLTLTATTNTKVYDGTVSAAATPTVTGLVAGDTVSGLAQIYDNKNVGTGKTLSVSAYTVNDGNGGNNYSVATIDKTTGVITPASLIGSITAGNKVYDGNTSATITSRTVTGVIAGDTVSYVGGMATFADKNAGVGKTVTGTGLALAGADAGNYTVNSAATTAADITAAPLTITAATNTKTYDGTVSAAAIPNVAGLQAGDTVTGLGQVYDNRNAGTAKALTVTSYTVNDGNGGNNYTVNTVVDNTGIINPALLTIKAATNTKTYDGTVSAAAIPNVAGLQAGDTATGLVQVYGNKNAGTGKTLLVSGYTVNDGNGGNNYSVSTVNNTTGVINPAALTVTADTGQTKVYGDADPLPFVYAITSGGLVAGDSLTGALSRIAGENVGSYALIQNTLTAGTNYSLMFVSNPFTITPATLTYLASPATVLQGKPFPVFTGTAQGFKGADTQANATTGTLAFNTTTTSSNTVGVYPINGSGLNANFGNYVFVQAPTNSTALTIEPGGTPIVPGRIPDGYVGALASAAQSESACAQFQDSQQTETLCGAQQNFRQAEQVNLIPGWRRVIDLGAVSLTVEGEGLRLPDGALGQ